MSISIQWRSGDDTLSFSASNYLGFYGEDGFGASIPLDSYQENTILTNENGTVNSGEFPNTKFISSSNVDWGEGSKALTLISSGSCTLHIKVISDIPVRLQAVRLIAYSGSAVIPSAGSADMNIMGFEYGNSSWTVMDGSDNPLILTAHTGSATYIHNYHVGIAASPVVRGTRVHTKLALYLEWY